MRILKIFLIFLITTSLGLFLPETSYSKEIILYDFEKDLQGWEIPDWAFAKPDSVGKQIGISEFHSSSGKYSLEVDAEFTGGP